MERKLKARWLVSVSLGYAKNRNLVPTNVGNGIYNSWYTAVRFSHQIRPETSFFLSYGARLQVVPGAGCVGLNCATHSVGHDISAGFNFGLRPILFR